MTISAPGKPLLERFRVFRQLGEEPIIAALASLVRESAVYLAGGFALGLGNVILVPLYARSLEPREFGIYALIDISLLLLVTITALKLDVAYLKWFAELTAERRGELLGTMLLTGLGSATFAGLILSLLVAGQAGQIWLHTAERQYAWLLLPIVVLETLQALILTDFRARRRPALYSLTGIVRLGAMVPVSYYLMTTKHFGLNGLFLGRLAGDAVCALFLAAFAFRSVVWRVSAALLKPMLRFALPLVWSAFALMFQDASGRYFLNRYGTLEQVGLLGASIKVGAVFQLLVNVPFSVAWGGVLFQIVKQRDAQAIYSKIFAYVYVLALSGALVLTLAGPLLFRVFTAPAYYEAVAVLPMVLLVRAMNAIEQPASTGVFLAGRTGLLAVSYTLALAANLLLMRLLVPGHGLLGVGWAWLLGSAIVPVSFLVFGQRRYRLSFQTNLLLFPVLLWFSIYFLLPELARPGTSGSLAARGGLAAAVIAVVCVFLGFDFYRLRRRQQTQTVIAPATEVSLP